MIRLGGDPKWIGWDSTSEAVASVHDAIVAIATGLGGNKSDPAEAFFPRPGRANAPADAEVFAPSIAEFNVGRFMSIINSS